MCEIGRRGKQLLQELKSYDRTTLPPFNEDLIRLVFSEIEENDAQTRHLISELKRRQQEEGLDEVPVDPKIATTVTAHYECIKRNKRLLLIYMKERMERLKAMRWINRSLPKQMADRCCPAELQFYREYDKALNTYMGRDEGIGMDLTLDTKPPKDTHVLVRGLKDVGDIVVSYGMAKIIRAGVLTLPLEDAEPLIRDGVVEEVDWKLGYM